MQGNGNPAQIPWGVTATNYVGRLSEAQTFVGSTVQTGSVYSYDPMGRIATTWQCTPLTCGTTSVYFTYKYDWLGNLTSASNNGDNVTYTNAYDNAARLTSVKSSLSDSQHPGTLMSFSNFSPLQRPQTITYGNNIVDTMSYDNRGRVYALTQSGVYAYNIWNWNTGKTGYAPNGNILYSNDSANGNWSYSYDDMNRLVSGTCSANCPLAAGFTYTYDRFGNRYTETVTSGTGIQPAYVFDANNHISGSNVTYDAAGNILTDGVGLGNAYTYDAENRIVAATNGSYSDSFVYDAFGHRVRTVVNSQNRDFLYDLSGRTIDQFVPGGSGWLGTWARGEAYAGGMHVASYANNTTQFDHSDWLGTFRVRSDVNGNKIEWCTSLPFGEDLNCSTSLTSEPSPIHFTGKERDSESGLDFMQARYYGSTVGRFMSPDPLGGHLEDPQTLNRYVYVRDNPMTLTDPSGLDFYLQCTPERDVSGNVINSLTCQQRQVGTGSDGQAQMAWVQGVTGDNGFTATQIGNDTNGNLVDRTTGTGTYTADVTGNGVQLSNGRTSATGVFLNKDVDLTGTNQVQSYDTVVRAGNMPGFLFTFQNSKMEANQTAAGFFTFDGTMHDAGEALNSAGFHYMGPIGLNWNHAEYRSWEDSSGRSGHFNLEWSKTNPLFNVPTVGDMHFGEHNPLQSPAAHLKELLQ